MTFKLKELQQDLQELENIIKSIEALEAKYFFKYKALKLNTKNKKFYNVMSAQLYVSGCELRALIPHIKSQIISKEKKKPT
jgi:hypothetical protein